MAANNGFPVSVAIVTDVEPESSSIGKQQKKQQENAVKKTIEETEKNALKMYAKSLQQKAKNEEQKRKKLLAQANTVATQDIEAKDKIAQASQLAAMAQKAKVDKTQKELDEEAVRWVKKNQDLSEMKKKA